MSLVHGPFSDGEGLSVTWTRWHHSRYLRGPCSFCILGKKIPVASLTVILTNVLVTCTSTFCRFIIEGDIRKSCLSFKIQELTWWQGAGFHTSGIWNNCYVSSSSLLVTLAGQSENSHWPHSCISWFSSLNRSTDTHCYRRNKSSWLPKVKLLTASFKARTIQPPLFTSSRLFAPTTKCQPCLLPSVPLRQGFSKPGCALESPGQGAIFKNI